MMIGRTELNVLGTKFVVTSNGDDSARAETGLPVVHIPDYAIVRVHLETTKEKDNIVRFTQSPSVTVELDQEVAVDSFIGLGLLGLADYVSTSKPIPDYMRQLLLRAEKEWKWDVSPDAFTAVGLYGHGLLVFGKNILKSITKPFKSRKFK